MKKVFILGCGWVGFPLAVQLKKEGYHVWGSTRSAQSAEKFTDAGITHVSLVVGESHEENLDFLNDLDVFIVAYPLGASRMSDDVEYQNHVGWIEETIARRLNPEAQVILLSSTSVYPDDAGEVDETCTLLPTGPGLIQLNYEKALQAVFPQLVILRLAGLIGEGRHPGKFFAGKLDVPDSNAFVNLVCRCDVINACNQVIFSKLRNEIINICADEHPERGVYYVRMAQVAGFSAPSFITERGISQRHKVIVNTKAKKLLGLSFSGIETCIGS
jgi:nucleoside-diphosphate-sugar epimerase